MIAEIEVNEIEMMALKKLSLVSHMLATKVPGYRAREEQRCLAMTLDDIIRRIELAASKQEART